MTTALLVLIVGAQPDTGPGVPPDNDSNFAVPIGPIEGPENEQTVEPNDREKSTLTDDNMENVVNMETPTIACLPGTVLGVAIKTDGDVPRISDIKPKPTPAKKELTIKQYAIKRKYKPTY